ncbi:hypothetical protein LEN26_005624 [Aphanomyces euteiches]|nr:hypothetical protein AeMF1_003493 [Aphanomyces euteiches]KAH9137773.1 hypothetical protein LEN26_005624 [Aphanomyces euteiches]KAH9190534.1 hypothetical protein AeNC1_007486 [Aphanomyces euteiches]
MFQDLPTSKRLQYLPPSKHLDDGVYQVYSEEQTMQFIPFLCRMAPDAWAARRESHRSMWANGTGAFFDIVEPESGEVVGTSGFRVIELSAGDGEWGVVLSSKWHGRGFCNEIHDACMKWAARQGLHTTTAMTWETNTRMITLLERYGWKYTQTKTNELGIWREYAFSIKANE